jgi:glycosyltransferase involved in cell wall biosynthesis
MTGRLRVLQVADLYEPFVGGMEQHVQTLSRLLTQRGHEVTVATARLPGTAADETTADGIRVCRITGWAGRALEGRYERPEAPFHPPAPDPGVVAGLAHIIGELRPDIVHAQGWITYSCLATRLRRSSRLVVTLHDHGMACPRRTLMRHGRAGCPGPSLGACLRCAPGQYGALQGTALTLALRAARPLHARADSWVAISQFVANANRRVLPRGSEISVIPPASEPPPPPGRRPAWLPPDGYLLFVGALGRHKGLHWLLDAYASGGIGRPLVVIGTERADTPTSWPAGVTVRTSVPHPEVIEAWRHAGVGVIPSLWPEPFGLVAVEAMRSGVPVVASRTGALPDVVVDGNTGFLVAPGNTAELVAAIRRLDLGPGLRRALGRAGVAQAKKFSAQTVADRYEEHYRELLAGRHPRSAVPVRDGGSLA